MLIVTETMKVKMRKQGRRFALQCLNRRKEKDDSLKQKKLELEKEFKNG